MIDCQPVNQNGLTIVFCSIIISIGLIFYAMEDYHGF
jgi:hypothetical protein